MQKRFYELAALLAALGLAIGFGLVKTATTNPDAAGHVMIALILCALICLVAGRLAGDPQSVAQTA